MIKTTIRDNKNNLPIGILSDGKRHKEFSLRPSTGRIDKQLAIWDDANSDVRDRDRQKFEFRKVAKHLSLLLERVGGISFPLDKDGNAAPESELRVMQMPFSDVLYAYTFARIKALGEKIHLPFICPHCKHQSVIGVDLQDIDVFVPESEDEVSFWVDLRRPLTLSNDSGIAKAFKITPLPFSALINGGFNGKINQSIDLLTLQASIVAARTQHGDKPYTLLDADLDNLDRFDILTLSMEADKKMAGPRVVLDVTCPKCGKEAQDILDWSYTFFFDLSFRLSASTI
jgi:hypothetical protein